MPGDEIDLKATLSKEGAGLDLHLGEKAPSIMAKFFPGWAARASAREVISAGILQRLRDGVPLSYADVEYARLVFGDAEAKWIRRKEISARAAELLESDPDPRQLPSHEPPATSASTAEDWISRFWDDAGLVCDGTLQEIYSRLLASEAVRPGTCSMRTLRTLRYMDRHTAQQFADLLPFALRSTKDRVVTWRIPNVAEVLEEFGLHYDALLDLDDAGILDSSPLTPESFSTGELFECGDRMLRVRGAEGYKFLHFPLRLAGRELAEIAHIEPKREYLKAIGRWLAAQGASFQVQWAVLRAPRDSEVSEEDWKALDAPG